MFSNLNKPAFGAGATNPSFGFGSTATSNPFGQSQLFGKPTGSTFGSTTSTFGQTPGSTLFPGTQPQTGGLFQSSTPAFGAPATSQTGFGSNVFGSTSQQPAGGGLFGSSAFGQQNKPAGFGFGGPAAQPSLFGQTQPTAQQTASPFQPSTSSTLFGGSSGFGAAPQTGTVIKFQPLTSTDTMQKSGVATTINTKHHCITCMKEYEGKSLEELRWEDYQANRKGPQPPGFVSAPFSSQPSTGFGSTFGMGAQTSNSQNLFGKPSGFGTTTTTASSFGFGTGAMSGSPFSKPFGTPTTQPLFGGGTQQAPTFGGGMFSQQQSTGLFGKPQTTSAFGTGTPGFSFSTPPTTQASNLFSASKTNTPFPAFGQTNTAAPAFGQQQPAFGQASQPAFGASTFGKPTTGFGQPTESAFGTGLGMQQGSLFTNLSKPGGNLFAPSTGTTVFFQNNTMPQASLAAPQQQPQPLQLPSEKQNEEYKVALNISDQFGQLIQLATLKPEENNKRNLEMSRTTKPDDIEKLLVRPLSPPTANPLKGKVVPSVLKKPSIFDGLAEEMSVSSASLLKPRRRLQLNKKDSETASYIGGEKSPIATNSPAIEVNEREIVLTPKPKTKNAAVNFGTMRGVSVGESNPYLKNVAIGNFSSESESSSPREPSFKSPISSKKTLTITREDLETPYYPAHGEGDGPSLPRVPLDKNSIVILTRPQYYTVPTLDELEKLKEDGKCFVKGFTVGRVGYGNVYFPEKIDVSGLNLDEIVHIRYREVVLYPDEMKKPAVGQGLNRRAQITLDGVSPVLNGEAVPDPDDTLVMHFTEYLREVCERKGMRFLEYRPDTGSFVFEVDHFTRYGLDPEDVVIILDKGKAAGKPREENAIKTPADVHVNGVIAEENGYDEDDEGASSVGPGGMSIPDIEMADLENSENVSEFDIRDDKLVRHLSIDSEYPSTLSSAFDEMFSRNSSMTKVKEVRLMKSSLLFGDEPYEEDDVDKTAAEVDYLHVSPQVSPKWLESPSVKLASLLPRKPSGVLIEPEIFPVTAFFDIEAPQSRNLMDLAIFKGKSAKIGWMKGFTFLKPVWEFDSGTHFTLTDVLTTPYKLQVCTLKSVGSPIDSVEFLTSSLKIFQEECDLTMENGVPLFRLSYPHKFVKQQLVIASELATQHSAREASYFRDVWGLCWALFGPMRHSQSNRMVYFNKWLQQVILPTIEEKKRVLNNPPKQEICEQIYLNLTGRRIREAAALAVKHNFPQLSLLISTSTVMNAKNMLAKQMEDWNKSDAISHIDEGLIRIYLLLAGIPSCGATNICCGLEWLRAFAVHVWYVALCSDPLGTAVELYETAFKELGYAASPYPSYYKGDRDDPPYDVMYHLILLFTKRNVLLDAVLDPATYTSNALDYRLSWCLLQVFTALKVGTISEHARNYICTSFANQLEELGMWQYSIFVLLFVKDSSLKTRHVLDLLYRNLPEDLLSPDKRDLRNFLMHQLKLPSVWVHSVLADKARFSGDHCGEFHHLLHSDRYHEAQNVAISHIVSKMIINKSYKTAVELLEKLEPHGRQLTGYNSKAGLLLDALRLVQRVSESDDASSTELLNFHDQINDVCKRIKSFPTESLEQRLCIAEISKCCAVLMYNVGKRMEKPSAVHGSYVRAVCSDLLRMPPDYRATDVESLSSDIVNYYQLLNSR